MNVCHFSGISILFIIISIFCHYCLYMLTLKFLLWSVFTNSGHHHNIVLFWPSEMQYVTNKNTRINKPFVLCLCCVDTASPHLEMITFLDHASQSTICISNMRKMQIYKFRDLFLTTHHKTFEGSTLFGNEVRYKNKWCSFLRHSDLAKFTVHNCFIFCHTIWIPLQYR